MLSNLAKVINFNKPFYATDLELKGGDVSALQHYELVKETGETRTVYLDLCDDFAKKITVKEWVVNPKAIQKALEDARKTLNELQFIIDALEAFV